MLGGRRRSRIVRFRSLRAVLRQVPEPVSQVVRTHRRAVRAGEHPGGGVEPVQVLALLVTAQETDRLGVQGDRALGRLALGCNDSQLAVDVDELLDDGEFTCLQADVCA